MRETKASKIWGHFFGYILCFVIGGIIAGIPRFTQGFEQETGIIVLISEALRILITLLLLYFYTKHLVEIDLNVLTLSTEYLNIGLWMLVGIGLPIITITLFYITGNLTMGQINTELTKSHIFDSILNSLGLSLAAGIVEEVVFRGYLFNLIRTKYNIWISALAPSLFFTILHIGEVGSILNVFQLLVAGLLVSFMFLAIYLYTKSVWNASIVHFLWNFIIFNKLLSFGKNESPDLLVRFDIGDNNLFNGGDFGIETSIPAIIIYGLTFTILWRFIIKRERARNSTP